MKGQFIRFVLVGVINTFTGLSVIFSMKMFLDAGDVISNSVGYLIGLMVSFTLNRSWTFSHQGSIIPAIIKFSFVFLVAYGFNLATVLILIHWIGANTYFAQVAGLPPYTLVFFLLSKFFVFRGESPSQPRDQFSPQ